MVPLKRVPGAKLVVQLDEPSLPAVAEGEVPTASGLSRLAAIEDLGMVDAYRSLHATEVQYTWWDYRAGSFHKGLGMRIDLALVSAGLADRLRACGIDREYRKGTKPSDHAPLLLDLAGAPHS